MRITQWGEYGIHCITYIWERQRTNGQPVGAAEIADKQRIALDYAQQILQRLRKGGLIESVRGPHGGYKVARAANTITLRDILIAAEGDTFEVICENKPLNLDKCSGLAPCGLRTIWYDLKNHVDSFFEKFTLDVLTDQLADSPSQMSQPVQIGNRQ